MRAVKLWLYGTPQEVASESQFFNGTISIQGKRKIPVPKVRREGNGLAIKIIWCVQENNLKGYFSRISSRGFCGRYRCFRFREINIGQ